MNDISALLSEGHPQVWFQSGGMPRSSRVTWSPSTIAETAGEYHLKLFPPDLSVGSFAATYSIP